MYTIMYAISDRGQESSRRFIKGLGQRNGAGASGQRKEAGVSGQRKEAGASDQIFLTSAGASGQSFLTSAGGVRLDVGRTGPRASRNDLGHSVLLILRSVIAVTLSGAIEGGMPGVKPGGTTSRPVEIGNRISRTLH